MRLSCEGTRFDDLAALTRHLEAVGTPVMTFSLHSTSLTAGANAYAPDAAGVDRILALTRRYLEFFTKDFRGEPTSLSELARFYAPQN
jgi:hypothetical protein